MICLCKRALLFYLLFTFSDGKIASHSGCEDEKNCQHLLKDDSSLDVSSSTSDELMTTRSVRRKRSFNIPNPSKLDLELLWSIPVSNVKGLSALTLETDLSFDLSTINNLKVPTTTTAAPTSPPSTYTSYANKRIETHPAEITRIDFYRTMENFLERQGYNGKECTLRTLCEMAEAPFEHGIYGELLNMVMTASLDPTKSGGYDKYMTAEYYGKHYGECGKIYHKCKDSVLDLFSKTF